MLARRFGLSTCPAGQPTGRPYVRSGGHDHVLHVHASRGLQHNSSERPSTWQAARPSRQRTARESRTPFAPLATSLSLSAGSLLTCSLLSTLAARVCCSLIILNFLCRVPSRRLALVPDGVRSRSRSCSGGVPSGSVRPDATSPAPAQSTRRRRPRLAGVHAAAAAAAAFRPEASDLTPPPLRLPSQLAGGAPGWQAFTQPQLQRRRSVRKRRPSATSPACPVNSPGASGRQ
jgi:hypothetical protein